MSKKQIHWFGTFNRVKNENDLKLKPGENINPPHSERKCHCCGRPVSELKPFGGPGDPLNGDFTGAFFVRNTRSAGPYDEEAEKAVKEAEQHYKAAGFEDLMDWMIEKYGKEKAEELYWPCAAYHQVGSSWECRDCRVLDDIEYFKKLEQ